MSDIVAELAFDLMVERNENEMLQAQWEDNQPSTLEKVSNSSVFKVGLFVLGAIVGRELVVVAH